MNWLVWNRETKWTGYSGTWRLNGLVMVILKLNGLAQAR